MRRVDSRSKAESYWDRLEALLRGRARYVEVPLESVPRNVRFDVSGRRAGQMVERAYGGFCLAEHDEGDEWMRVVDRSVPVTRYYRLVIDRAGR